MTLLLRISSLTTLALATLVATSASAAPPPTLIKPPADVKLAFRYDGGEISAMIAAYSKATGQKFIIDPGVRGKATVLLPGDVSAEEAFNILCDALAINGYSLFEQGDTFIVKSSRNAQRDAIPTYTELPPPRPNRMVTYIVTPKYVKVEELNKRLRILPSKDGEMSPFEPSNQLIISDYSANINRIAALINEIDTPETAKWKAPTVPPRASDEAPRFKMRKGNPPAPNEPPPPVGGKRSAKGNTTGQGADELDRLFED